MDKHGSYELGQSEKIKSNLSEIAKANGLISIREAVLLVCGQSKEDIIRLRNSNGKLTTNYQGGIVTISSSGKGLEGKVKMPKSKIEETNTEEPKSPYGDMVI